MFDFNKVELFSSTQIHPKYWMTHDEIRDTGDLAEIMEYCARVSNVGFDGSQEVGKLLGYLVDHKHWSPLEMVDVTFEVWTKRDIGRQLLRHGFKFQEFSQRYASTGDIDGVSRWETRDDGNCRPARRQDTKNRQNSIDDMSDQDKEWWLNVQKSIDRDARRTYQQALDRGIAKEVARAILPEGLTDTRMFVKGDMRTWFHYCQVRTANGTQLEHMDFANKILAELIPLVPTLFTEERIRDAGD